MKLLTFMLRPATQLVRRRSPSWNRAGSAPVTVHAPEAHTHHGREEGDRGEDRSQRQAAHECSYRGV